MSDTPANPTFMTQFFIIKQERFDGKNRYGALVREVYQPHTVGGPSRPGSWRLHGDHLGFWWTSARAVAAALGGGGRGYIEVENRTPDRLEEEGEYGQHQR